MLIKKKNRNRSQKFQFLLCFPSYKKKRIDWKLKI